MTNLMHETAVESARNTAVTGWPFLRKSKPDIVGGGTVDGHDLTVLRGRLASGEGVNLGFVVLRTSAATNFVETYVVSERDGQVFRGIGGTMLRLGSGNTVVMSDELDNRQLFYNDSLVRQPDFPQDVAPVSPAPAGLASASTAQAAPQRPIPLHYS